MKASAAISSILRSMLDVLQRQDSENERFQLSLLRKVGELKATTEANNELLVEVRNYLASQDMKYNNLKTDLHTHVHDSARHLTS